VERDYLKDGAFVNAEVLPSAAEIETFYTQQLISRTVNSQWRYVLVSSETNAANVAQN
jgi:hypothetical protein